MAWRSESAASGRYRDDPIDDQPSMWAPERGVLSTMLVPLLARSIVAVVFIGFCVVALMRATYAGVSTRQLGIAAAYMSVLLVLQLFYFTRPVSQLRAPQVYVALAAQAALAYLPLLEYRSLWIGMPTFLAGSVLLILPPVLAWVAFAAIVGSVSALQWMFTGVPLDIAYSTVSAIMTGLVVFGLARLANLITELYAARKELARMAVAQERLRFARDLHDLLGYSLSAITLKSELTHRLVTKNPDKAQDELAEILDISRKALSDVRSVASGYRELSLDNESESARSVLLAADVEVTMDLDYGELPTQVRTVLATVLREGVTNVLRHSKAERCDIIVRQLDGRVSLDIVNDGVQTHDNLRSTNGGSGIRNLSERIEALRGELFAGLDPDGRYRLHAWAPVPSRN